MPDFAKQYETMYEEQLLKIRMADLIPEALAAYDAELRRRGTPECLRKADEPGFAPAQLNLGAAYHEGQGVPQDYALSAAWYRKAAEQGDATAQFNLGAACYDGQGVPRDYTEAYFWLNLAASGKPEGIGAGHVAKMRDDAAHYLESDALTRTQERSERFFEEHSPASVGNKSRMPKTDAAKRSRWPSVVGWILIVIGLLGGMQQLKIDNGITANARTLWTMASLIVWGAGLIRRTRGTSVVGWVLILFAFFDELPALATHRYADHLTEMAFLIVVGVGFLKRSWKLVAIGVPIVLLAGLFVSFSKFKAGARGIHTVAETLAGPCGMDGSGNIVSAQLDSTDGVVTHVDENSRAYLLQDTTGGILVMTNKKLQTPNVNDRIQVLGMLQCPPLGASAERIFLEMKRFRGAMSSNTANEIVSTKAAITGIEDALRKYKDDTGAYPSSKQGLSALHERPKGVKGWRGPYFEEDHPKDPWGHDYLYRYPGEHGSAPDVLSLGPNSSLGGQNANGNSQTH